MRTYWGVFRVGFFFPQKNYFNKVKPFFKRTGFRSQSKKDIN